MVRIHIIKSNYSNYCHCVAVASADISSTNTIELKSSTINSEFIVINNKSKFNVIEKKFEIEACNMIEIDNEKSPTGTYVHNTYIPVCM